jgi:hypothetical protein
MPFWLEFLVLTHRIHLHYAIHEAFRTLSGFLFEYTARSNSRNEITRIDREKFTAKVEERLERLEKEVTLLTLSQSGKVDLAATKPGWIAKIRGSFKDSPDFAEILRLGREERKNEILNDE